MNNKYAPVIIFAYNREDHLKRTLSYLQKNTLAKETDIIVYSDSWKNEYDKTKVLKVRNLIESIKGFGSIEIIERQENYGLSKNIIDGVDKVLSSYGRAIVLEDDLLTSSNFLCYMNSALDFYGDRNIFSISGYTMPIKFLNNYRPDTYLSYRPSSWGWGTWKEQWEGIDWEISDFKYFIKNKSKVKKFNRGGIDMARMLKHSMEGKNHSWAIRWSYAMYKQNKYSVYPRISKVQNIGFGEDATNCKGINIYKSVLDTSEQCDFNFSEEISPDKVISKEFRHQYSYLNKALKKAGNIFG